MSNSTLYFNPQDRAGSFGISSSPALCNFNGALYMAWRGAGSNDDKIYYASFDGTNWSAQNRAGSFGISGSPALCVFNGLMYMAWRGAGSGDDKIYYASFDGSSWSGQNRAGSFGISSAPTLSVHSGAMYMAWRGAGDGDDKIYYASFNGSSWSGQNRAGGFGISDNPALCDYNGLLYLAWRGAGDNDDKIYYASYNGSWSGQNRAGSFGISGAPEFCVHLNRLYMSWRGAGDGDDEIFYASFDGSSWSDQDRAGNFGISSNAAMASFQDHLYMAWRGAGDGDDKIYFSFTYDQDFANWMRNSYDILKDRTLREICIPGAHDAATYTLQHCSTGAGTCNTQTQRRNMVGMLEAGVRYFDIRPAIDNSTMYSGHFSNSIVGIVGCCGDTMQNILDAVKSFMEAGARELVVLKFSHYLDRSAGEFSFTSDQMDALINQVEKTLNGYLPKTNQRLADIPMSSYIGTQGSVLAVFDQYTYNADNPGIYSYADLDPDNPSLDANLVVYDHYSDTNDLDTMVDGQLTQLYTSADHAGDLFLLSWTLTLSGTQATFSSTCISEIAMQANNALIPNIRAQMDQKKITEEFIPNIIYTDFCDGFVTATCMALNQMLLTGVPA
ncbi:MAG: cell surface protein [Chlorobi bacterium]|nr:cell surface protein [Chlorobiota bacterium]